ncbi:hypothetical protein TAO_0476 [Candidatus Nitrosoglobus terrae]|uniref:Uncharacterized protein n=1 Tax=Candidatus Nitrosoglobus terrae TaxID=1630141 RepID=A0A1Q2SL25_9GAMM|nr:hypothetical protein [Candidatus Nitrosoglobus terrae]BAW79846.1 hypothetical protein TAO_0476 [Candidatus Nitrosoglobus terrae]
MKAVTFFRAQSRSPYNRFKGRSLLYKLWFKVTYGQAIKVLVGKETGAKGKIRLSPNNANKAATKELNNSWGFILWGILQSWSRC